MSKRQGDVALSDYHKNGYLPEALINFMVLLGWNPGTEREIFSLPELIKEFSLEKVQKAGAVFNIQRLDFINGLYIREKSDKKLAELCLPYLHQENVDIRMLEKIVGIYKPRIKKLSDIQNLADFFFIEKLSLDKNMLQWQKMGERDIKEALTAAHSALSKETTWDIQSLEKILMQEAELFNLKKNYPLKNRGYMLWPLRVALSGKEASASPFEIADILGKEKTLQRIQDAIDLLG
jgi:glutamyl/glutaminyl-tRNA synthetase